MYVMANVRKIGMVACAGLLVFALGVPLAWGDPAEPAAPNAPGAEGPAASEVGQDEKAPAIGQDDEMSASGLSQQEQEGGANQGEPLEAQNEAVLLNEAGNANSLGAEAAFDPAKIPSAAESDTRDVWVRVAQDAADPQAVIVSALLASEAPQGEEGWGGAVPVTKDAGLASADASVSLNRDLHLVVDAVPSKASGTDAAAVLAEGEDSGGSVSHAMDMYFGDLNLSGNTMHLANNVTTLEEPLSLTFNGVGTPTVQIGSLDGFEEAGVMVGCALVLGSGTEKASEVGQLMVMNLSGMMEAIKNLIGDGGALGGGESDESAGLDDLLGGLGNLGGGDGSGGLGDLGSMFAGFSGSLANKGGLRVGTAMFLGSPLANSGFFSVRGACQAMMGGDIVNSANALFVAEEGSQVQAQLAKMANDGTMRFSGSAVQLVYAQVVNNGELRFEAQAQSFGSASSGDIPGNMPTGALSSVRNNGIMTVAGKTRFMKDAPVTNAAGADLTLKGAPMDVYSYEFVNEGSLLNEGELNLYGPLTNAGSFSNAGLIALKQNIDDESGALDSVGSIVDQEGAYDDADGKGRVTSEVPPTDAQRAVLERLGMAAESAPGSAEGTEPVPDAKKLAATGDGSAVFAAAASAAAALACAAGACLIARRRPRNGRLEHR